MNYDYFHGFFILLFSACIINRNLAKAEFIEIKRAEKQKLQKLKKFVKSKVYNSQNQQWHSSDRWLDF